MASKRKIVFQNYSLYHIFNRGIDRRPTFQNSREFNRAIDLISFYNHKDIPIRYSQFIILPQEIREVKLKRLSKSDSLVDILAYCLMPNHFHFLLRQRVENGLSTFISNFTNSYTKYFNTKNQRIGPLFEGVFKAVYVENDDQAIHLSRYIHLNPVVSSIVNETEVLKYKWSSYPEYLNFEVRNEILLDKDTVLSYFKSVKKYQEFVMDQIDYGKKLEEIKHLKLE